MGDLDRYARHTRVLREEELGKVMRHFKCNPSRVLEIGAGNGWHAQLISALGHYVEAIDTAPWLGSVYPVHAYDGVNIPFSDGSFDVVFSSSVLEHIADLCKTEREIARVLDDTGVAIHIVPTPVWRILTTLTYYPALPWITAGVFRQLRGGTNRVSDAAQNQDIQERSPDGSQSTPSKAISLKRLLKWACTLAVSPRHGERGNRITEAWYFRKKWWECHFIENGFDIISIEDSGILYGGNILFGDIIPIRVRRYIARIFGSSSRIFILKKQR
ncbi:MAG: class I SAM-dependent methyltransferase [Magnetospirillum sp.]|nr:MAG: class I SAM-dependent methyltransferase [Magnetospirillum sp.]